MNDLNKLKPRKRKQKIAIIISGMPSVGKTTAANEIARKFNLKHIAGGDMLKEMAVQRGYDPSGPEWWDTNEGMKFLAERSTNSSFDLEVDEKLISHVREGGVVITSYTVPWLCSEGLKLWFGASLEARAKRLAGRDTISLKNATEIVKRRDLENALLYSQLYHIDFGKDLSVFNYVINTENMTAKHVAQAAAKLVEDYKNLNRKVKVSGKKK